VDELTALVGVRNFSKMDLLIATANAGKVREFRQMLDDPRAAQRIAWSDLASVPAAPNVEETGRTFRANACLKASTYAKHFNRWTLADDSGLEVDALDGAPGVYSARWAQMHDGAGTGGEANNRLLLQQLAHVPHDRRDARFVCVLALADPQGRVILTVGDFVAGQIIREPRGSNGFGYDPLFFIEALGKTTAELLPDEKHAISHRGKALRGMRELMRRVQLIG
jgi:XTP/dITP diphosphohydrolase